MNRIRVDNSCICYKWAFTLAEVLITLTIIGVIAALTIPNLMQKWQDHAEISAVKKVYSVLDNAIKMAITENGPMEDWGWPDNNEELTKSYANAQYLAELIKPYLKVEKICGVGERGCFDYNNHTYNKLTGELMQGYDIDSRGGNIVLSDGVRIHIDRPTIKYGYYTMKSKFKQMYNTHILVDTNGPKGPNRMGYDFFKFGLSYNGLVPTACAFDSTEVTGCSSADDCSCYYWILKHNNMDYKHRDVSAEW